MHAQLTPDNLTYRAGAALVSSTLLVIDLAETTQRQLRWRAQYCYLNRLGNWLINLISCGLLVSPKDLESSGDETVCRTAR